MGAGSLGCGHLHLTVREHLEFYTSLKGIPKELEAVHVDKCLRDVGLHAPEVQRRYSKNLSGGMKRRLSIAIALTGHSKVIFLDEPTTGLDPARYYI